MKKYTRKRARIRYRKRKTRSLRGGGSKRPTPAPTPAPTPTPRQSARQSSRTTTSSRTSGRTSTAKLTTSKGVVVSRSRGHSHVSASSRAPLRNAGILKKQISKDDKDDTQALEAAKLIAEFPLKMDKFLKMVVNNYELLNYEGVKLALREQISINEEPAVGRLSKKGIIFISYICGKLVCLLNELSTLPKTEVDKKSETLDEIKKIERVICLLDGVGCSWGIRPYSQPEMDNIAEYYRKIKDDAGLRKYHQQLNEFINKYFPVLTKYTDPSHVVSSSMCRRLIPHHIMSRIDE
jgi:hypothetical protein